MHEVFRVHDRLFVVGCVVVRVFQAVLCCLINELPLKLLQLLSLVGVLEAVSSCLVDRYLLKSVQDILADFPPQVVALP